MEASANGYIYILLPHLRLKKKNAEKQMRRLLEPKNQGVCCKILSLNDVRNFTPKISPTLLPKHEVNKNNINRHAKVYVGQKIQEAVVLHKEHATEEF